MTYRSNGKLLLTAEYAVLDGATALAIPTTYGQSLQVETHCSHTIYWKSYDENDNIWFEDEFIIKDTVTDLDLSSRLNSDISERLIQILKATYSLNPTFLKFKQGYNITTHQDFNRLWGLGTSSTLINNIANWAGVDAYQLLKKTFGGSGYDIACAQQNTSIVFQLKSSQHPIVKTVDFKPEFKNQLYFVYLNQKQNSRDGISAYKTLGKINKSVINDINSITESMIICQSLIDFQNLIEKHESIIADLIEQVPIKLRLFPDFKGAIKSLGAWGGDFVLVACDENPSEYFNAKGYDTVIPYSDMV